MLETIQYRKDIQIIRGIAVLMVTMYHLGVAGFHSGFLGVDVFFVISGYLMAAMYNPLKKKDFFLKRAKRLLPAYFSVILFVLLISAVITKPSEYNQVSNQAMFATIFSSNIGFWLDNSYFDKVAFKPLLHLWSLGVELQFYLTVPIFYWIFTKSKLTFLLILLLSAFLCFIVVGISPKTSFFLLPFRVWEFLLGFIVAKSLYKIHYHKSERLKWLGTCSLVAIVCIPLFHISVDQPNFMAGHPGLFGLLISIATSTTLLFGISERIESNPFSKMLEKIGGYSYSIYLAHFPVIVLYLYQPFAGTLLKAPSALHFTVLVILMTIVSAFLFSFIERPFRTKTNSLSWMATSVTVILMLPLLGGVIQRMSIPPREMLIYQAWFDRDVYRCGKIGRILDPSTNSCQITRRIENPSHRILLVGNSHADSIKSAFSEVAENANISTYFIVENNPLMKGGLTPTKLINEAAIRKADAIVLHYSPKAVDYLVLEELATLAKERQIQLSFIMPVPVWQKSVPAMLIDSIEKGEALPLQSIKEYQISNNHLANDLSKLDYGKFRIYPVADVFCRPDCRLISENGKPLYFDNGHLTLSGSKMLIPVFSTLIADLQH